TSLRRHRMVHPFIAVAVDILLGAERPLVEHHLRALIDERAGVAAERHAVLFALEEILPQLRPDLFQQEPYVRRDRIVSQHRVIWLQQVANAEKRQTAEDQNRNRDDFPGLGIVIQNPDAEKQRRNDPANRQNDVARRERKHQRFHGTPQAILPLLFFGRSLIQVSEQCCQDISPAARGDDNHQASQSAGGESICAATGDIARQALLLQCNVPWSDLGWPTPHWGGALAPSRTMRPRLILRDAAKPPLLRM